MMKRRTFLRLGLILPLAGCAGGAQLGFGPVRGGGTTTSTPTPSPIPGSSPSPTPTPTPTPSASRVTVTPETIGVDKGSSALFRAEVKNPVGSLRYRWFIAAPSAYLVELTGAKRTGTDIETTDNQIKVQTAAADEGKLKVNVQVFSVALDGTRTLLGESFGQIEIPDVRPLDVTRVSEFAPNKHGTNTEAYFWEFPSVAGAKHYIVTMTNKAGVIQQRYRILQGDIDATAVTTIPLLTGDDPFPPAIPVREELSGVVRANFYRRGTGIRYLIVWGGGFDPNTYYENNPISVVVYF